MTTKQFSDLLNTGLKAGQVARILSDKDIRLSTYGWSKYTVENGVLIYHHHYGDDSYSENVESVDDLTFYDRSNRSDFEYSQEITPEMVKALRNAL